ncbi:hypothetical protein [Streptomyces lydicus]|uniref:hypothetical protein n=1 Tax=Streptomyces lydicus TaxID=47763 RepID=UPI00379F57CE
MPESWSGRTPHGRTAEVVTPIPSARQRRLATLLADMMPGARRVRVSTLAPGRSWPSPYTRAYDEHGRLMTLSRTQGITIARWVIRTHPGAKWEEAYDLDLTTGMLMPAADAYAATSEGR